MLYNFTVSHIPKMIYSFLTFTLPIPFQIAVKRREAKSKGEKEKYNHLNADFKRIAKRDKKAFFSDWCKEREVNSRMGKTRDLYQKIRDTKGIFHAKMGTMKERNRMDLTSRRY